MAYKAGLISGASIGCSHAKVQGTNWVKTANELPEDGQWCVVCVGGVAFDVACYDDNTRYFQGDNYSYSHESISHWLALPPMPEGE
ncbi:hypothetical protein AB7281_14660 [Providencia rettgeri]